MASTSTQLPPAVPAFTTYTPPSVVQDVVLAAGRIASHAEQYGGKDSVAGIVETSNRISSAASGSCQWGQCTNDDISPAANSALAATTTLFKHCADALEAKRGQGILSKLKSYRAQKTFIADHTAAFEELSGLLKVHDGRCGLIEDPDTTIFDCSERDTRAEVIGAKINALDASYNSFKFALQGLTNMAEGLPWPLKAAPQTALQVIRQLEDAKASEPKANNLIRLICDFGQMLAQHQSKDLDDEAMRPHIRRFFDHLQVILIRVRICRATGKFKTLTTASRIKSVIEEEASNVQRAQELLVTAFAVATHSIVRDIKKTLLESPHNIPMQIRGGIYISAVPPPMAIVFHGREQQLETLLQALLADKPARLGISGAGGIGKTALALAILHNERIKLRCGNNRIFISCEAAVDVDGLLAIFAQTLALPLTGDLLATIAHYFKSRPGSLVVLDNIETIWLSRNSALNLQMERFLGQLAEIDELDLIVTTRGTLLPSSVRWSNRSDAALDTLYFDAARKVFQETVQETAGGEDEDEALNELLREVDFMPLAVTLLARLGELPSYLLSQWKEMYTELLQVDSHDNSRRELSVEVSIQLSLNFLPSPGFDPEPFQLLAVCSLLPDGIFPETLESLQPTFTRLDRAVRILRHHALIYFGLMGELRMLSPIRHYLRKKLHVSGKHFAAIRMRYYALAASVPTELAEDFPNRSAKIAPEYGNMTSVLLLLISTEAPTEPLFAAVDSVTQYSYWTTRSSALCEAWIARGGGSPEWLAKMWNAVGRLNSYRNDLKTSQCNYETARGLYEQAGNRASAMQATRSIGYTLLQQDLYDEAETMFKEAHAFFMEQNDEVKSADCVQDLSMVCDCRLDHPTAIKHQFAARQVYVAHEKKLQAALALANIGNQHNAMENFPEAVEALKAALQECNAIGSKDVASYCGVQLADVYRKQGKYDDAEEPLAVARTVAATLGKPSRVADVECEYGLLRRDQGRFQEAIQGFATAKEIWESVGMLRHVPKCDREMAIMKGELPASESHI